MGRWTQDYTRLALYDLQNPHRRLLGIGGLWNVVQNRGDITVALPVLLKALDGPKPLERNGAAMVLAYHYLKKGKWSEVEKLLDRGGVVWLGAIRGCTEYLSASLAARAIVALEPKIEKFFSEWLKRQPPEPTPEKIRMQTAVVGWMKEIATRKAGLARENDGKMLAGETIKRPKEIKGRMYRAVLRMA